MNVYDMVLAEAKDLAQAASEAQQLGRIRLASSYLLLLHVRLVGLGKRFDKADRPTEEKKPAADADADTDNFSTPRKKKSRKEDAQEEQARLLTPHTARVLSDMLPADIELDQAMMEHLARAAAQLHTARNGRKKSNTEVVDWNALDPNYHPHQYPEYHHNHHHPPPRPLPGAGYDMSQPIHPGTPLPPPPQQRPVEISNTGIVWSLSEMRILQAALDDPNHDPVALAKQLGRNPAQVRAFLRNQNTKSRIAADLALEGNTTAAGTSVAVTEVGDGSGHNGADAAATAASGGRGGGGTVASTNNSTAGGTPETTPNRKKRGGRGPKPPTTAFHTIPNASCNASSLLQGGFLAKEDDPTVWLAQVDSTKAAAKKPKEQSSKSAPPTKGESTNNKSG
jgi:hypothetical protein